MFRNRSRKLSNNKTRVEALIRRDRAAIKLQDKIETRQKEDEETKEWDYSLFRRFVGDSKKKLNNWFWDKW